MRSQRDNHDHNHHYDNRAISSGNDRDRSERRDRGGNESDRS